MKRLVPTDVAAVALGVTPEAVRKMRERGTLTRYGSKRRALVDLAEVEALVVKALAVHGGGASYVVIDEVHVWNAA